MEVNFTQVSRLKTNRWHPEPSETNRFKRPHQWNFCQDSDGRRLRSLQHENHQQHILGDRQRWVWFTARVVLKLQPETRREQVTTQLFADDHPIKTQHKSMKRNLTLIRVLRFCKNSVRPLCWICNELNFRSLRNLLTFCQSATPASSRTTTAVTATGSCRKSTDSTRPIKSAASISRPSSLISTRTLRLRASSTFWKQVLLLETWESWYGGY